MGNLALTRLAVGDHLLLGGDNMDLALAYNASQALSAKGTKLDAGQMLQLTYACRNAKEELFMRPKLEKAPVTVLGKGRSIVGGTIKHELSRGDMEKVLVDGFFPDCPRDASPAVGSRRWPRGKLGLPYCLRCRDHATPRIIPHRVRRKPSPTANHPRGRATAPPKRPECLGRSSSTAGCSKATYFATACSAFSSGARAKSAKMDATRELPARTSTRGGSRCCLLRGW